MFACCKYKLHKAKLQRAPQTDKDSSTPAKTVLYHVSQEDVKITTEDEQHCSDCNEPIQLEVQMEPLSSEDILTKV